MKTALLLLAIPLLFGFLTLEGIALAQSEEETLAHGQQSVRTVDLSHWESTVAGLTLSLSGANTSCPPPPFERQTKLSAQELQNDFALQASGQNHCEAYASAATLAYVPKRKAEGLIWIGRAIDQLFLAKDYRQLVILGLRGLRDFSLFSKEEDKEKIRWKLVSSVFTVSKEMGTDRDILWLEFALGISHRADPGGNARFLALEDFISDFPDSENTKRAKEMNSELLKMLGARELHLAKQLAFADNYFAAISHLESLYKVNGFAECGLAPQILYYAIQYQLEFAEIIEHPKIVNFNWSGSIFSNPWSLPRLQTVFHDLNPATPSAITKEQILSVLRESAKKGYTLLQSLDRSKKWANAAHRLFVASEWESTSP